MRFRDISSLHPILKWAGGKRQLLSHILEHLGNVDINQVQYFEPFLGGGALLFELLPPRAFVNDKNEELINMYRVIKDAPEDLISLLEKHQDEHSKEHFYDVRSLDRQEDYLQLSNVEKAARLIYLNRTCYNGLFRVNSQGFFNTPIGRYTHPKIVDKGTILAMSKYFNKAEVHFSVGNYADCVKEAKEGDFVYFDPPYVPLSKTSNFTAYTKDGFSLEEQVKLKELCDQLNQRNVLFVLSNSCCDFICDLYKNYDIDLIEAKRQIGSVRRENAVEVLVSNF